MLYNEESLLEWTGFNRRCDLEKWLREHHIPFYYGRKNQICTTQSAIDNKLSGTQTKGFTPTAIEF